MFIPARSPGICDFSRSGISRPLGRELQETIPFTPNSFFDIMYSCDANAKMFSNIFELPFGYTNLLHCLN